MAIKLCRKCKNNCIGMERKIHQYFFSVKNFSCFSVKFDLFDNIKDENYT